MKYKRPQNCKGTYLCFAYISGYCKPCNFKTSLKKPKTSMSQREQTEIHALRLQVSAFNEEIGRFLNRIHDLEAQLAQNNIKALPWTTEHN